MMLSEIRIILAASVLPLPSNNCVTMMRHTLFTLVFLLLQRFKMFKTPFISSRPRIHYNHTLPVK